MCVMTNGPIKTTDSDTILTAERLDQSLWNDVSYDERDGQNGKKPESEGSSDQDH